MSGPVKNVWSVESQSPWYVENQEARLVTSCGIARNGNIVAIAVSVTDEDEADAIVEALNEWERSRAHE